MNAPSSTNMNRLHLGKVIQRNARLRELLQPKMTRYIKTVPTAKQTAFMLLDDVRDAFYGGAAGGGKSEALLMCSLQYVDCPDYAALIIRNTFQDLSKPGALMDRAKEWLYDTDAHWNETTKTWTFPSGARLVFGYLDGPDDHLKYKSSEFQFIGLDEAGDMRWKQMMYLHTRLRKTIDSNIPLRYRMASNPGGISHNDLKARYIDPLTRGNKVFISAKMADNPHLDQAEYEKSLDEVDIHTRAQLRDGDWEADIEGVWFQRNWFPIIQRSKLPRGLDWRRFWDLAATEPARGKDPDWTACPHMAHDKVTGKTYIDDMVHVQLEPSALDILIKNTAEMDGLGTWIWMEQEPGASGKIVINNYRKMLRGWTFNGIPSTGNKEHYVRPLCGPAEKGEIILVSGEWNKDFLDEVCMFPKGAHDDQIDATAKGYATWYPIKSKRVGVLFA